MTVVEIPDPCLVLNKHLLDGKLILKLYQQTTNLKSNNTCMQKMHFVKTLKELDINKSKKYNELINQNCPLIPKYFNLFTDNILKIFLKETK